MNAQLAPAHAAPFDIVAIVSSAGGLEATTAVLTDLPSDFPAAILVAQHLGVESALVEVLAHRTVLPVEWVREGGPLQPGCIYVSPPHTRVEVLPDCSCTVAPFTGELLVERPLDALLFSLADNCAPQALAVVLTGLGRDGAAGARALRAAGGAVLVQSVESAAFADMPRAAVEAGAADLVLPLPQIGRAIELLTRQVDLAGAQPERGRRRQRELLALLPVGVYACDAQGRFSYWNRRAVELWGRAPEAGDRHWALCGAPRTLDADGRAVAPDASPMAEVLRDGRAVYNREMTILRHDGARLDLLLNIQPLRDASGVVGAVAAFQEVTARKQAERSQAGGAARSREPALGGAAQPLATQSSFHREGEHS